MSEAEFKYRLFKFFSKDNNTLHKIKIPKEIKEQKYVEETYRMLEKSVEQSIDGIAVADMKGTLRFCNKAWATMHGYCVCEILGKHLSIFHTDKQMQDEVKPFNKKVKKNGSHYGQVGHVKKNGETFLTWMTTTVLKDEKEKSIGLIYVARDITEHKKAEERLLKINRCLLNFSSDANKNINELVTLCGELMGATCALYNRLEGGLLCSVGKWNTPSNYNSIDKPEGHICYDVIKQKNGDLFVVRNLPQSRYARTDPNVAQYNLQTYVGLAVRFGNSCIGSLCVVYQKDYIPSEDDKRFMQIIASAIAVEEKRRLAEVALRKSEERFRQVAENALEWIWEVDANGLYTYVSPAIEDILGYKPEEIVGKKHFYDLFHPEDKEKLKKQAFEIFLKREPFRKFVNRNIHKEGKTIWLCTSGVPMLDDKGGFLGYRGADTDITKQKFTEDALKESEERWRSLVQNIPDIIMTVAHNGTILAINHTFKGFTVEDTIGRNICEFLSPENCDVVMMAIKRVFRTERSSSFVIFGSGARGPNSTWYETRLVPIKQKHKVVAVTLISTDITERKRVEKQQLAITSGLHAVVEAADQFILCPEVETIFRRAVEFAREKFGLERCAIFLEEGNYVRGIYGTDRYGRTTDEHANRFEKNQVWRKRLKMLDSREPRWFVVREPQLEWNGNNAIQIGEGWIVITPIHSINRRIGVFVNDAAISGAALDPMKQDTLAVFCSLLGSIIERKRAEEKLEILNRKLLRTSRRFRQLALRDSHTGLYNHRYLENVIEAEFNRAKRSAYALSVIMLDIDYFKSINDVYGHQFGDLILKQFARQLKRQVRQYDIVVRFGGEEFIIISPGIDRTTTLALAQRILDNVYLHNFGNDEHSIKLKLSAAVVSYPEDNINTAMDLINTADKILNKVKEDGGDRVYSSIDMKKIKSEALERNEDNTSIEILREKLEKLSKRANQSLFESIFAFAKTIKLRDQYTGEHVESTVNFATEIAKRLKLSDRKVEQIKQAAKLHDLGKIGISDRILLKNSRLTSSEFAEIKKHPMVGADILRPIQSLHDIIPLILYHHERWDGKGYPYGLKQEQIPIGARIVALADVYQALISDRPYRPAFNKTQAIKLIKSGAGTQFDPKIVETFLTIV
jgi:diguanylate cyclase (GGDEF)-like protein/PAS domain S-box-containing protein